MADTNRGDPITVDALVTKVLKDRYSDDLSAEAVALAEYLEPLLPHFREVNAAFDADPTGVRFRTATINLLSQVLRCG